MMRGMGNMQGMMKQMQKMQKEMMKEQEALTANNLSANRQMAMSKLLLLAIRRYKTLLSMKRSLMLTMWKCCKI